MAQLIYKDFLSNKEHYHAAEKMWQSFFEQLAEENNFSFHSYLKTTYINGEPFYNGNPMYTALVPSLNRAIRIIQVSPEEAGDLFISGWLNSLDLDEEQPGIEELVISLVLSEETKAIASEFIHAWLVELVNTAKMDQLLEEKIILAAF